MYLTTDLNHQDKYPSQRQTYHIQSPKTQNKEKILKAKGKRRHYQREINVTIVTVILLETMQVKRQQCNIFKGQKTVTPSRWWSRRL